MNYRLLSAAILLTALAGACSPGPEQTWDLAAQGIYTGEISSDSRFALIGSLNHGANLWRIADYERLFDWNHKAGEPVQLVAAAFSPDGSRAVTTDPRTLVIWDTATGQSLQFWGTPGAVLDAKVVGNSTDVLLGMEDHSAILFDAADGTHKLTLLHDGQVTTVDVTADGSIAVTGSDDNRTIVWSLETGEALQEIDHDNPVRQAALSPDGQWLLTAISNDNVSIWESKTSTRRHLLHDRNPGVTAARFSSDGQFLLLGTVNRFVELWHVESGKRLNRWELVSANPWRTTGGAVLALAFTNGEYRALAGDGRLSRLSR